MAKRVYTGREPVAFVTGGIGQVGPGDEIDVPDALLEAFDRRADIAVPAAGYEAAEAALESDMAETRASRRRPGGKQSGGAPAAEAQEAAP